MMRSVSAEMEKRSVSMLRSGGRERAEKDEAHHIVLRVQFDMRASAAMARLSNGGKGCWRKRERCMLLAR